MRKQAGGLPIFLLPANALHELSALQCLPSQGSKAPGNSFGTVIWKLHSLHAISERLCQASRKHAGPVAVDAALGLRAGSLCG